MEGKQTIIQIAKDIYGETVQVYLFGSRLNDEKRGGDIDLLVRSTGEKKGVLARIRMTARLKLHLGDQKIGLSGNFWLVSFKISYLCLPLFYETRTTPSCHPSGCAYRQL